MFCSMASEAQPGSAPRAPDDTTEPHRPLWPKLLLPLALLLGIVGGLSFGLLHRSPKPALPAGVQQSAAAQGFDGTLAVPARQAPPIQLRNYLGQPVTLSEYRGRAVLVTFLYTNCPDVCPLITAKLRAAQRQLGAVAAKTQIIAVSVDPRGDTPPSVARFLSVHEMTGRMQYLIGSPSQLAHTWAAWSVGSTRDAGQPQLVAHSALIYGITASGRIRTIYPADFAPSEIVHDVPKLAAQ